jgi:hypothetical protein
MTKEEMTNEEAINTLKDLKSYYNDKNEDSYVGFDNEDNEAIDLAIKALDIELLTDTEQRIFLKAMSREREICQKVDNQFLDDDSTVSLVKVCNSIERKVKKIWE